MQEDVNAQPNEVSLREYLDILLRRKAIVVQTFVVVLVVGAVATWLSKPVYRSTARILVEGKALSVAQYNANDPLSGLFTNSTGHDVSTQIEVLQSPTVVAEAFEKVDIPRLAVDLKAKQVEETDVIEITAESTNRNYAGAIARQLPETYKGYVSGNRKRDVSHALEFARNRYKEENDKLMLAELQLQRFLERKNIGSLDAERQKKTTKATTADSAVSKAETDLAGADAKLHALNAAANALPKTIETPTTTTNPQIELARAEMDKLKTERSRLLILYKPTHAEVQKVDAAIADVESRLARLPATVTTTTVVPNPALLTYRDKINDGQAEVAQCRKALDNARQQASLSASDLSQFGAVELKQAQLERDVDTRKNTVLMLAKSVEDLSLRVQATSDPVIPVQPATEAKQVAPRPVTNLVLAAIVGLMMGLGFALLQEYLDDRINSPDDARLLTGVPTLGYVPLIADEGQRMLSSTQGGNLLESYRTLRSSVQFATVDLAATSVLVTSTVPGEGKSLTASNLAIAMALDGKNVILVDADLRRPTLHRKFGIEHAPGLTNVLIGHTPLDQALQPGNVPGLRILASGPIPPNPAELLNSRAMHELNEQMKALADVVIYDSPPCLATADAQVMAAQADGVLYVMQLGETRKSAVRHAIELLDQAHARLLGVVFNKLDTESKRYGYGSYGYYYNYYDYYSSDTEQITDGKGRRRRRHNSSEFDSLTADAGRSRPTAGAISGPNRDDSEEG